MKRLSLIAAVFAATFALAGCEDEGPMERLGENADETVEDIKEAGEDTKDAIVEACEDVTNKDCNE